MLGRTKGERAKSGRNATEPRPRRHSISCIANESEYVCKRHAAFAPLRRVENQRAITPLMSFRRHSCRYRMSMHRTIAGASGRSRATRQVSLKQLAGEASGIAEVRSPTAPGSCCSDLILEMPGQNSTDPAGRATADREPGWRCLHSMGWWCNPETLMLD